MQTETRVHRGPVKPAPRKPVQSLILPWPNWVAGFFGAGFLVAVVLTGGLLSLFTYCAWGWGCFVIGHTLGTIATVNANLAHMRKAAKARGHRG